MANGDIQSRNTLGDIQTLLTMFKGSAPVTKSDNGTSTSSEIVSSDKANAYLKQILESNVGLASVSSGQKAAGIYGSTTNQMLTNDLLSRVAAQTAALSSTKTTTNVSNLKQAQGPQLDLAKTLATVGAGQILTPIAKAGAKKYGLDNLGNSIADSLFGASGDAAGAVAADTVGTAAASSAGIDIASALATGSEAAETAATIGTAAEVAGAAGTAAEGAGLVDTLGIAAAAWIICTELKNQGRLPCRYYIYGAREFAKYDERGKQGYYIWAIPSVKHLKKYPNSLYSKMLEVVFNARAEYLSAKSGCKGARKTVFGFFTTHALYAFCWTLSRTIARKQYSKEQIFNLGV